MANGWTPERRARQAERIKQWRPWNRSTGPKTTEGKGDRRATHTEEDIGASCVKWSRSLGIRLLREQREALRDIAE